MNRKVKTSRIGRFHYDTPLATSCLGLLLIGYVMVTSSSLHLDGKIADNLWNYPVKQLAHITLGMVLGKCITNIPVRSWEKIGPWLFILSLLLLVVVMIPGAGHAVNGSTRWLSLGGINIQVSELVKFAAVVYMAGYIDRHQQGLRESMLGMFKPLILFCVAGFLLLLEPDFGSTVVILIIAMGMMFLAGARLSLFIMLLAVVAVAAALLVIYEPYRMKRVTSFVNPWADALDTGFQLVQALIAFGRGEVLGVGLGNGIQKLFYLPEAHTDFLFSVIAEELGLLGVLVVIGLFSVLIWRSFTIAKIAEESGERFAAYLAYGLGIWFGFQAFVNMGVNMGVLPTKGLTLPLMSYGGGSVIVMCCAVGLLFRVHSEITEKNASDVPAPRVRVKAKNG